MKQDETEKLRQSWKIYLKFSVPIPGCLAVTAENNKVVCYAFGRIQEKYENDAFKDNNNFSYWDMNEWYKKHLGYSYHTMWAGFNLPVKEAVTPFLNGEMNQGHAHEQQLIEAIKRYQPKYVIGYNIDDYPAYKHELKHAMFYLSPTYRKSVLGLLEKYRAKHPEHIEELENYLRGLKYSDTVLLDELHAYITEKPWSVKFKLGNTEMHKYRKAFQRGIKQLNSRVAEDHLDVTGTKRLRKKIDRVAVEGMRTKFKKATGLAPKEVTTENEEEGESDE